MIQLVEDEEKMELLQEFCKDDVFGCKVESIATLYGDYNFASCWIQVIDDTVVAAISKMEGIVTISARNADLAELKKFVSAVGFTALLCSASVSKMLKLTATKKGPVMVCKTEISSCKAPKGARYIAAPSLQKVHELLEECASDTFVPPDFEAFYVDMSHRIRHKGGLVVGILVGDQLVACAIVVAETHTSIVIGAVAVHPDFRRKGFGLSVVRQLIKQGHFEAHTVYALCDSAANEAFYQKLGLVAEDQWIEI